MADGFWNPTLGSNIMAYTKISRDGTDYCEETVEQITRAYKNEWTQANLVDIKTSIEAEIADAQTRLDDVNAKLAVFT